MTQEDKELSFIDMSGRLHYGVIVNYKENEYDHRKWEITTLHTLSYSKSGNLIDTDCDGWISYEEYEGCGMSTGSRPFRLGDVLPYLRPMSSMTEEEIVEINSMGFAYWTTMINNDLRMKGPMSLLDAIITHHKMVKLIDWLNSHHFDYRGLIEKGLALEAPTDMYK